ncbi:MAG TPA: metallophosphoesterase [Chitinophagaceae bacterium]|nr:metallophosphoesterase [Chitinophagaceae bacterium]
MKPKLWLMVFLLSQGFLSCEKDLKNGGHTYLNENDEDNGKSGKGNRHLKISIISDIHYMDPSLLGKGGAAGAAFQAYLDADPKMVQYSDPIFRKVLADVKQEKPDMVLVTGDITKDGEKTGHLAMARFFHQLEKEGIKVYVVPGNHDINNAKAKKFIGDNAYPVEMTSKNDFANIYADFGYNNAVSRDPNSLSYVAQPQQGLRIISIDASKYEEYGPSGDVAAGRIKPQTLVWILKQLAEAKQKHISVFAMMHHNLIEHYAGQSQLDPGYVIDDWQNVANTLADAGLKIIFTGHYHANDISSYTHNGNELIDIETGSLVTAPSPYRFVTIKSDRLEVSTKTVQSIDAALPGGLQFPAYANLFLSQHLDGYFNYYLANKLGAPAPLASFASPLFRNGIMAHFAGDENMPPDQLAKINELATMSQQLAGIVTTLWTDLGEKDNNTIVRY